MDAYNPEKKMGQNLDSQLWHGIAGKLVKLPTVNSRVLYFPQGHAEHAADQPVDFNKYLHIPSCITCKVSSVQFLADPDFDEIYAKIGLTPIDYKNDDVYDNVDSDQNWLLSISKTLTASDANNGGGFSVPKAAAMELFPKLDMKVDIPTLNLFIKDVHGKIYEFRYIYRGTPRRHLFTTGWSNFVNDKLLVKGDSVIFFKRDNGDLCVATRLKRKNVKVGKLKSESVIEAAKLAADGKPFEVVYYPRRGLPEFCVKADVVMSPLRFKWGCGERFKMPYELGNCIEPSWVRGTITSVQPIDPIRWPNSRWRSLQVRLDEPEVFPNETSFSPWSVERISDKPNTNQSDFDPPRKKFRPLPRDLPVVDHLLGQPYLSSFAAANILAGIQGARKFDHKFGPFLPYGVPLVDLTGAHPDGPANHISSESNNDNGSDLPKLVNADDSPPTNTPCLKLFGFDITESSSNESGASVETRTKEKLVGPLFSDITNRNA